MTQIVQYGLVQYKIFTKDQIKSNDLDKIQIEIFLEILIDMKYEIQYILFYITYSLLLEEFEEKGGLLGVST